MDIEELSELIKLHGKSIYGFCYKLTGNKVDADDLYQETFLKATEMSHKINMNQNPKAFLLSIANGIWKNNRRKFARRERIAPVAKFNETVGENVFIQEGSTPEKAMLSKELHRMIRIAADELDEKLKIPLYMYYTAEMPINEIALALGIPSGTVKSRLHRARKAMKGLLEVGSHEKRRGV